MILLSSETTCFIIFVLRMVLHTAHEINATHIFVVVNDGAWILNYIASSLICHIGMN